jgi:hypothetical protein
VRGRILERARELVGQGGKGLLVELVGQGGGGRPAHIGRRFWTLRRMVRCLDFYAICTGVCLIYD